MRNGEPLGVLKVQCTAKLNEEPIGDIKELSKKFYEAKITSVKGFDKVRVSNLSPSASQTSRNCD